MAIVGPTASGKSDLAMALAPRLPAEIVVADSRQVYRGMDIGTAKPSATDRQAVPHHLLDLVDPDTPFTVADWVGHAHRILPGIADRGRLPLIVAGTGLYLSALVNGYAFPGGRPSPEVRTGLSAELAEGGLPPLAERLERLAPAWAAEIDLRNPRRVLRALERMASPDTVPHDTLAEVGPYPGRLALIGLSRPRDVLDRRIDARAERLFASGLVEEVRELLAAGYAPDLAPLTGHGYREAAGVLSGALSLEEAIARTARRTRQYARRQLTWFRRDLRIVWLAAGDGPADERELVDAAIELVRWMVA